MIRIIRSRLPDGRAIVTGYLACDLCGRTSDPARVAPADLAGDVARLRVAAEIAGRWCVRTVWRHGDDRPVVGDVCGKCRGASLALRRH